MGQARMSDNNIKLV